VVDWRSFTVSLQCPLQCPSQCPIQCPCSVLYSVLQSVLHSVLAVSFTVSFTVSLQCPIQCPSQCPCSVLYSVLPVLLITTVRVSNKTEVAIQWTVYLRLYNGKVSVRLNFEKWAPMPLRCCNQEGNLKISVIQWRSACFWLLQWTPVTGIRNVQNCEK